MIGCTMAGSAMAALSKYEYQEKYDVEELPLSYHFEMYIEIEDEEH
jgi:hypothetical protein